MSASNADWAVRYIEKYGLALVQIPRGQKAPLHQGWNQPGGYVTDTAEARQRWGELPDRGIGAVLAASGLCSVDVDRPEHAEPVLAELGIDLSALREGTPTIQGDPARYRLMFRAPPGVALARKTLAWPAKESGEKPVLLFEVRAGDLQDVLPPTIHPGTGKPYVWMTPPNSEFPLLPEALLELWQYWGSYAKELEAMCPWAKHGFNPEPAPRGDGARPNVIAAFNQVHSVEELLEAHGYKQRGKRWMSPTSSSGLAGVVVLDGRVYSHDASDPLADGHAHDAFDLFRILDHGGDARSAVKAAAEELGLASAAGAKASAGDKAGPGNGGTEARLRRDCTVTLGELFKEPEESTQWLVEGLLPASGFSVLAAKPKVGKSTLARQLALAVAQGECFLGRETDQGPVLYVALEEKRQEVRTHFRAMGASGEEAIHVYVASAPEDAIAWLRLEIERVLPVLVIIDGLFRLARVRDASAYAEVMTAMEPLLALSRTTGTHLLATHHATKRGKGRTPS